MTVVINLQKKESPTSSTHTNETKKQFTHCHSLINHDIHRIIKIALWHQQSVLIRKKKTRTVSY